jgi:hypothetical protein
MDAMKISRLREKIRRQNPGNTTVICGKGQVVHYGERTPGSGQRSDQKALDQVCDEGHQHSSFLTLSFVRLGSTELRNPRPRLIVIKFTNYRYYRKSTSSI